MSRHASSTGTSSKQFPSYSPDLCNAQDKERPQADTVAPPDPSHLLALADCLHAREKEWVSYPCLPFSFVSDWMNNKMYHSIRNIAMTCEGVNKEFYASEDIDISVHQNECKAKF